MIPVKTDKLNRMPIKKQRSTSFFFPTTSPGIKKMNHIITISQENIDQSTPGSHSDNPILRALGDAFPDSIFLINELIISENNTRTKSLEFYHVPKELLPFNIAFDSGQEIEPMTFVLETIIEQPDTKKNNASAKIVPPGEITVDQTEKETKHNAWTVIDTEYKIMADKVDKVSAIIANTINRYPNQELNMLFGNVRQLQLAEEEECKTIACISGFYALGKMTRPVFKSDEKKGTKTLFNNEGQRISFKDSAKALAKDAGFRDDTHMITWAAAHPSIWGNTHGISLFPESPRLRPNPPGQHDRPTRHQILCKK